MRTVLFAVLAAMAAVPHALAEGDAARGEQVFRVCSACHQIGEGARHGMGPQLNGLIGRTAGSAEGSNNRFLFASSPVGDKLDEIDNAGVDGIIAGHCGLPFTQVIGSWLSHNPGVIGLPRGLRAGSIASSAESPLTGALHQSFVLSCSRLPTSALFTGRSRPAARSSPASRSSSYRPMKPRAAAS